MFLSTGIKNAHNLYFIKFKKKEDAKTSNLICTYFLYFLTTTSKLFVFPTITEADTSCEFSFVDVILINLSE